MYEIKNLEHSGSHLGTLWIIYAGNTFVTLKKYFLNGEYVYILHKGEKSAKFTVWLKIWNWNPLTNIKKRQNNLWKCH